MAVIAVVAVLLLLVALLVVLARIGLGLAKVALVAVALVVAWLAGYLALRGYDVLHLERRQQRIAADARRDWIGRSLELAYAPCIHAELAVRRMLGSLHD